MNFVMFYLKKLMVHNGILMETNGISVMVSIVFFSREGYVNIGCICQIYCMKSCCYLNHLSQCNV